MQKSKLDAIYRLLGCNNSDLARVLECSPSDISRIRTGSRTYKPTSRPVLRFAEGIYLFADRNGSMNSLCNLCGTKTGAPEEVVPHLIAWLFETDEVMLPDLAYMEERVRSIKKQKRLFFGEKLCRVMELTSVSNIRLARSINTDVSVVSRFRNGLRKPKSPTDALLASVLYDRAEKQNKLSELSALCGKKDGDTDLSSFSEWLYDDSSVGIGGIDKLLDSIEHFSLQEEMPPAAPTALVTEDMINSEKSAYIGLEGIREAVMRFLFHAASNGGELFLYSDQNMAWMVGDPSYRTKWMALMTACIKAGVRIRIIHNIDRGTEEMLDAIRSWMPLYMTGMIEPYVCHLGRDHRFAKTIFIRKNAACIVASVLRGKEDIGYYEYVKDPDRILLHTTEFKALLANSSPLLNVYFHDDTPCVDDSSSARGLFPGLSFGSMPADLLQHMLKRADLTEEERETVLRTHREKKNFFDKLTETGSIREYLCLPSDEDLFSGKVRIPIPETCCEKELFYTPEEYSTHIAAIIERMETHAGYDIVLLPEIPFSKLRIIATEKTIAVTRTSTRFAAFVFSDPRLLRSFAEYFSLLDEQYRTDKNTVKSRLMRFL